MVNKIKIISQDGTVRELTPQPTSNNTRQVKTVTNAPKKVVKPKPATPPVVEKAAEKKEWKEAKIEEVNPRQQELSDEYKAFLKSLETPEEPEVVETSPEDFGAYEVATVNNDEKVGFWKSLFMRKKKNKKDETIRINESDVDTIVNSIVTSMQDHFVTKDELKKEVQTVIQQMIIENSK